MRSLADIIFEANEETEKAKAEHEFKQVSVAKMRELMGAIRTKAPKAIAAVKEHLDNVGEFELYEFLQNCEFWEVRNKNAPHWHQSAGVRPGNGRIEFYYDADFIDRLAKSPGQLIFLIAHEASHIFRYHIDRTESQGKDPALSNIAQDAIINHDILETPKIGGWDPKFIKDEKGKDFGIRMPKKFKKDFPDKKAYYYENMYDWILKNKSQLKGKGKGEGEGEGEQDYFAEGSIVRVKSGTHKDEYRKITKVNKDGTYETEEVDINKIKEELKKS